MHRSRENRGTDTNNAHRNGLPTGLVLFRLGGVLEHGERVVHRLRVVVVALMLCTCTAKSGTAYKGKKSLRLASSVFLSSSASLILCFDVSICVSVSPSLYITPLISLLSPSRTWPDCLDGGEQDLIFVSRVLAVGNFDSLEETRSTFELLRRRK